MAPMKTRLQNHKKTLVLIWKPCNNSLDNIEKRKSENLV